MSNNKNGFELRTDLLGMAIGLLENNRDQIVNQFYSKPEKTRESEVLPIIEISPEQVIAEAEKLYDFVTTK